MPSLIMIAFSISAVVAGPLAVFAPLGMAPLSACVAAISLFAAARERMAHLIFGYPIVQIVLLFLAWMLLTTIWTFNPLNAAWLALRTTFLIAGGTALAVMLATTDNASRERLAQTVIVGFALLVFLLAFELLTGGLLVRSAVPDRYTEEPWIYVVVSRGSVFMALMMWPALLACRSLGRRAWIAAACAAAVFVALLTDHGGTRVGVAAGLVTLGLVTWFGRRVIILIGSLFIGLILSAPLLPFGPLAPHWWHTDADWLKLSAVHRLYIWHFTAERVWERPLLGWGMEGSRHVPGGDAMTPIDVPALSLHPHNAPLQVWLELGAVGAFLLAVLIAVIVRQIARSDTDRFAQATTMAALSSGFAIANLSFGIWQSWWVGSLMLMIVWTAGLFAANGTPPHAAAAHTRQLSA